MKKCHLLISAITLVLLASSFSGYSQARAFRKHSFVVGISEGSTSAAYRTSDVDKHPVAREHEHGIRDPLTLEYGLSDRWGIGINIGNDIFLIDPVRFYGTDAAGNTNQTQVNFTVSDATAPTFANTTNSPNTTAALDPNKEVNITANVTDFTAVDSVVLQVREYNISGWTN